MPALISNAALGALRERLSTDWQFTQACCQRDRIATHLPPAHRNALGQQGDGLPWRLSAAASETDSSEDPTSLLLGEEASLMHPIFEDADFERSFVMEGEDVREAVSPALRVQGASS